MLLWCCVLSVGLVGVDVVVWIGLCVGIVEVGVGWVVVVIGVVVLLFFGLYVVWNLVISGRFMCLVSVLVLLVL